MKALKPSHREKKRYLLIVGKDVSEKAVNDSILKFIGILGHAKASPMVVKKLGKKIIISINRAELEKVRTSLLMSGKDMVIERVSGAINKLK